jgi:carbon storage regulator
MLVLTRRIGQEIVIAGDVRVKVAAIEGRRVRLGITAPPSVQVMRLELIPGCSMDTEGPLAGRGGANHKRGSSSSQAAS